MAEIWSKWTLFLSRRSDLAIAFLQALKTIPLMIWAFLIGALSGGFEAARDEWEFGAIQCDTAISCKRHSESGEGTS